MIFRCIYLIILDEVSAEFAFLRHSLALFALRRLFLKKMSDKLNTALLPHGGLVIVALSGGADSLLCPNWQVHCQKTGYLK